jgi:hypothetical protein
LRLGGERGALQRGAQHDVADLDDPYLRAHRHQGDDAAGAAGIVDDGVGERIRHPGARREPEPERVGVGERPVGQVGPDLIVALERLPQIATVACRIELLDPAETALQHHRLRRARGARIDRRADRRQGRGIGRYLSCHDVVRRAP